MPCQAPGGFSDTPTAPLEAWASRRPATWAGCPDRRVVLSPETAPQDVQRGHIPRPRRELTPVGAMRLGHLAVTHVGSRGLAHSFSVSPFLSAGARKASWGS